jgi:glycosyltransferase involved in cell wall biosynthesis
LNILLTVHHVLDANSGAPGAVKAVASEYRKLGHRVDVLSFDNLPDWMSTRTKSVLFPSYVAAFLSKSKRRKRYHVIDGMTGDLWIVTRLNLLNDSICITSSHGLEHLADRSLRRDAADGNVELSRKYALYHGGWRLKEVEYALRFSRAGIFTNTADARYAADQFKISPHQCHVVPNGIADSLLGRQPFTISVRDEPQFGIATIASYIPRKGIANTARVMNSVLSRYPNVTLSLLGTGVDSRRVLADYSPAVHSQITVVPRFQQAELPRLLEGHQIKLFPSHFEGCSIALLEAMACGLVPVAFAIEANQEIVASENCGILVPVNDDASLESTIDGLISNPARLAEMQLAARDRAQVFSWASAAAKRLQIYDGILTEISS